MNEKINQGKQALLAGNKHQARVLLEQALQDDPFAEQAWLWLSGVVDTIPERRYCLQQALSINPDLPQAIKGLKIVGEGEVCSPFSFDSAQGSDSLALPEKVTTATSSPLLRMDNQLIDWRCSQCGGVNPGSYRFCDHCGAEFKVENKHSRLDIPTQPRLVSENTPSDFQDQSDSRRTAIVPVREIKINVQSPVTVLDAQEIQPGRTVAGPGKWFSMGGALSVVACFFLPWITVSCGSYGLLGSGFNETHTGYQLASNASSLVAGFGNAQGLYLLLGSAALALIILLFTGGHRISAGVASIITILGLLGATPLVVGYMEVKPQLDEFARSIRGSGFSGGYKIEIGLIGTLIGLVLMVLGALADCNQE